MSRVRNYCFTSHVGKVAFTSGMKYLLQGDEVGAGGKEHVQGFVIFRNPRALTGVIKEFKGVHWEICNGSIEQNVAYCKKEGRWTEEGEVPVGAGTRTDLLKVGDMVARGMTDEEIINTGPDEAGTWVRNYRGIREARRVLNRHKVRDWEMDVRIYWGATGTGKTRSVYEEFGVENVYVKTVGKWWDGYDGEHVVLIDDFDPSNCFDIQFDMYLKLLDRYPMKVEVKGGFEQFLSKVIVFTSNYNPAEWFTYKMNRDAFFRRVRTLRGFSGTAQSTEVVRGVILDPLTGPGPAAPAPGPYTNTVPTCEYI